MRCGLYSQQSHASIIWASSLDPFVSLLGESQLTHDIYIGLCFEYRIESPYLL